MWGLLFLAALADPAANGNLKHCAVPGRHEPTGGYIWRNICGKDVVVAYDPYGNSPGRPGKPCDAERMDLFTLSAGALVPYREQWQICAVRFSQTSATAAKGFLGAGVTPMTADLAVALGRPAGAGAIVTHVDPNSPAQRAGIRKYDIIVSINYNLVSATENASSLIGKIAPNSFAKIGILRDNKEMRFIVEIAARPADVPLATAGGAAPLTNSLPTPKGNPVKWVSTDLLIDVAFGQAVGATKYDLSVDKDGRVSECTVVQSAGNSRFEGTVCSRLRGNVLFLPATDGRGQPIAGTYRHSIPAVRAAE